ncbi:vitelline membrane outer layer protein 1 homolog, partial [Sphaerodactylus townsendi]|uniref:vitelline membrane outer layer protein 1 homolog n=1 Tax=Sphaerodactylus townsendi TaxID=933632 RepID=UPI002026F9BF
MAWVGGVVALVFVLSRALAEKKGPPENRSEIKVSNGGSRGAWAWKEMCPEGTSATGFSIKVEPYQGLFKDDTALNGVRLHCTEGDHKGKNQGHTVESQSGIWGKWS